jgi:predicted TIM-barrel fold metal-dependent hydrolase
MYALRAQPVISHLTSMIFQGVLEKFPTLRVLVVGAGMTWIPGFVWRLDSDFKAYGARETPWLKRMPSEQFAQQVRVSTHSFCSAPDAEQFAQLLETYDGIDDVLCFASGYPRWDTDDPASVAGYFPEASRAKVLRDNALALFRWPTSSRASVATTEARS